MGGVHYSHKQYVNVKGKKHVEEACILLLGKVMLAPRPREKLVDLRPLLNQVYTVLRQLLLIANFLVILHI